MKKQRIAAFVVLAVMLATLLYARDVLAAPPDAFECAQLGAKLRENPYALTIGEYDTLIVCAAELRRLKMQAAESQRIDRAIQRNFGKGDGE